MVADTVPRVLTFLHAETERTDETVETVIAVVARGPLAIGALVGNTRLTVIPPAETTESGNEKTGTLAGIGVKTEAGIEIAHLRGENPEEMRKSGHHDGTATSLTNGVIEVEEEGEIAMVLEEERERKARVLRQRKESQHQI